MRCSSTALVLGTLAAGQAAAHTIRHAGFHARRHADDKREVDFTNKELYKGVDWNALAVDWEQAYKDGQHQGQAPPAPQPKIAQPQQKQEQKEEQKETSAPAPVSTPAPSSTQEEEEPKETKAEKEPKKKNPIKEWFGDFIEGLTDGIEEFCEKKGISLPGKNDRSANGGIWLGKSDWSANFHNAGHEDVWLACWEENSFTGMTINVNRPSILVKIPVGANQTVSFAPKKPSACSPMYPDTPLANWGGVYNAWFEANFGPTDGSFVGTFDVSKNTRMNGDSISAVGSKCTSDMNTCVFECQDKSAESCEKGYELVNCHNGNGGGGGYDVVMQGVGGGCNMGATSEMIDVTFSQR